jgi:hypothetical protein
VPAGLILFPLLEPNAQKNYSSVGYFKYGLSAMTTRAHFSSLITAIQKAH